MGLALYAIALLGVWLIFSGTVSFLSVAAGGVVVAAAFLLFRDGVRGDWIAEDPGVTGGSFHPSGLVYAVLFLPIFLWKVLVSGLGIARFALTPGVSFWPGIVKTGGSLPGLGPTTILANLITLTPGTLTLDFDPSTDTLFIHWMDVSEYDAEDIDHQVTSGMRPWIRRITG